MRIFSSALASQAVLSATGFLVGLLLIRYTSDLQYGYYMLVLGGIIFAVSLQNAFLGPALVNRMARLDPAGCGDLAGGVYREQRLLVVGIAVAVALIAATLWAAHLISSATALLVLIATVSTVAALRREYFRLVQLAYRRAHAVLRADVLYAFLLGSGVLIATRTTVPAAAAALALAFAALVAGRILERNLRKHEAWNPAGEPGILRAIAPLGAWSTAGAAIHWSFNQGYVFLVAGTLDVSAVAAIAATRMLAMPVNLLSVGIGSLMLPVSLRWLMSRGAAALLQRLCWLALAMAVIAMGYFSVLWIFRDWLFETVLRKQFEQRDLLLKLWSASFIVMAAHQQLLFLLVLRERFRWLTALALCSALIAIGVSYWGMQHLGGAGAPLGILVGEGISGIGIAILCLRETAASPPRQEQKPTPSDRSVGPALP
ncbi:lipopolysaccharide biosynthesis protein [Pseudomarimonas salicorniae]|uniref:Membrane protein involved in the export of O-antigen and teichoic acid n=1 Tax=Pseudomarimonas salicorniae TaxID=2933270 RepID=A0ABT0GEW0_9GAMM|nr:hypothetical protein [Lysobacter sp. CAU 1642]MCK7593080.1 hypothetical protein [Lysobacter sp. CAU 1642]